MTAGVHIRALDLASGRIRQPSSPGRWHRRMGGCLTSAPTPTCDNSAPGGTRTPDPLVRSQVLYPLSYRRIHLIHSQML